MHSLYINAKNLASMDMSSVMARFVHCVISALIMSIIASLLYFPVDVRAQMSRSDVFYPKVGLVVGKTTVLDPDSGQPILVVVNRQGEEVDDLGPRVAPLDTMSIWNADGYRADAAAYTALLNELPSEVIQDHCIIELERYGIDHCGDAYVTVAASTPGEEPEQIAIEYPDQYSGAPGILIRSIANAKYVVLRHSSTIVDPRFLGSDGPVLLISRIDLKNLDESVIKTTDIRSVLLTEDGKVHYATEHNITYRTGYFEPTDEYNENRASRSLSDDKERALGPIAGAKVTSSYDFSGRFASVTDEGGQFRVEYYLPPCPCSSYSYPGHLWAEIPYRNFNPLNSDKLPFASFFAATPTYDFCSGYHYCSFGTSLIAQAAQSSIAGITASSSSGNLRNDIKFDAMIITGEGQLVDAQGAVIEVGETRYATEQQGAFENQDPNSLGFDFDLDRQLDQAVLHEGEYFIYLGGRSPEFNESDQPINEDIRRRPDQLNDYQDRGLLESISIEDLKQTDLYIYRVSTGELLIERQNLRPEEYVRLSSGGVDESGSVSHFYYRQMMRGPHYDLGFSSNRLSDWWSKADIRLELFDHNAADFLRMGESVQIIAINRPTGYIGSVTAILQFNTETGANTLDVPIDRLRLRAPNLKIRAERRTEAQLGLNKGDIDDYLIGSEGSGLTSDEYIMIKTEWFDHDGRPLPSDLPGYSGTLAKLVGPEQLGSDNACTSSIDPISIEPGSRIQLLKLGDNCDLGTEHYYVYVCGHYQSDSARSKCFSFGQTNDIGRPSYYVPVQVPFYNELASREAYKRYRYGLEEDVIEAGTRAPEPVYEWFYRPEMQFSVFDLETDEINRVRLSEESDIEITNILQDESPVISSSDDSIDVFYSLLGPEYEPLPMFGPDREFVLALGEHEMQVKIGAGNKVSFDNLESLDKLNPEDFLSMRLYANNDMANILWEWALGSFGLIADMNQDGKILSNDKNNQETPFLFWMNDDDDKGEIAVGRKNDEDDIPGKTSTADYRDKFVDGMRDLVDFFPVFVDAKAALNSFPLSLYEYRLKSDQEGLKFFETEGLLPDSEDPKKRIDSLLKNVDIAKAYANQALTEITENGALLSTSFLINITKDNGGIIFVESGERFQDVAMELEIVEKNTRRIVGSKRLWLSISDVEDMYRYVNVRSIIEPGDTQGLATRIGLPSNNPDTRTNQKYFAFVHGYNVTGEKARGWNAEVFKRMHRLGFNGRFIGVNWAGDTNPDYHEAVYRAFKSSQELSDIINNIAKGSLTIAAHSLGNIVVSNAIVDSGLLAEHYYLINAAVAIEAYDRSQMEASAIMQQNMTEEDWYPYPEKLYTANWHKVFEDTDDPRKDITWKDRFSDVLPIAYNFYSPGDDVVEDAVPNEEFGDIVWNSLISGDLGRHAWVAQEIAKGGQFIGACTPLTFSRCQAGWQFNNNDDDLKYIGKVVDYDDDLSEDIYGRLNGQEASDAINNNQLTDEHIAQFGFFRKFENDYLSLYAPIMDGNELRNNDNQTIADAQAEALKLETQWRLLGHAIPAISYAVAANELDKLNISGAESRNFDMHDLREFPNEQDMLPLWPQERIDDNSITGYDWLHSDFRDVATPYVYKMYEAMLDIDNLRGQ